LPPQLARRRKAATPGPDSKLPDHRHMRTPRVRTRRTSVGAHRQKPPPYP
jgi:hypothetical protein